MDATDIAAVSALLTEGFAVWRNAGFWERALRRLADRAAPANLPRFGYVLEADGRIVGVLLVIASETAVGGQVLRRCNVSSWYVEAKYRLYGALLVRQALHHRDVTYLNVSPAPETWPVLAAQGYSRYVAGRAVGVPALARRGQAAKVIEAGPELPPGPDLADWEVELLHKHARWECLCLVCVRDGQRVPFVFGLRRRRGVLGFAYLLYCRDLESVVTYARPLGLFLARRGLFFIVADADARLRDMPGWFQDNHPKFFRGDQMPRPGDLAYTERAVFGV